MNNIQTACFALIASAFILAGILIVRVDDKAADNTAQANGQLITQTGFTLMTARTRGEGANPEESLFILDGNRGFLIVYKTDLGKKRLEPIANLKMSDLF